MEIQIPDMQNQRHIVIKNEFVEQVTQLSENVKAPMLPTPLSINESEFSYDHLRTQAQGWQAPDPKLVRAYFEQFQKTFPEFKTDKKLAELLGEKHDRRIRAFKSGEQKVPYSLWRRFLVMTGRAQQEIVKVYGIMK